MPALQIRDLPQGLYDELKLRARREHRSLAQQATVAIGQHLRMVPPAEQPARQLTEEDERRARIAKRKATFAWIDAMPKVEIPEDFPDVAEIIHEGREGRLDRIGRECGLWPDAWPSARRPRTPQGSRSRSNTSAQPKKRPGCLRNRAARLGREVLLACRYSAICAWTAVMATTPTMSSAEQPRDRSFTGLAMPCRMGP